MVSLHAIKRYGDRWAWWLDVDRREHRKRAIEEVRALVELSEKSGGGEAWEAGICYYPSTRHPTHALVVRNGVVVTVMEMRHPRRRRILARTYEPTE